LVKSNDASRQRSLPLAPLGRLTPLCPQSRNFGNILNGRIGRNRLRQK
jgi:hypothetical protein